MHNLQDKNDKLLSCRAAPICNSITSREELSIALYFHLHFELTDILIFSNAKAMQWKMIIVVICTTLIITDIKCVIKCLLAPVMPISSSLFVYFGLTRVFLLFLFLLICWDSLYIKNYFFISLICVANI